MTDQGPPSHLTIAYQPGIGYAPLIILKAQRTLETQFPGLTVDWKVLASGAAITNGVISGDIDLGSGGVGPLLTGWAAGVELEAAHAHERGRPLAHGDESGHQVGRRSEGEADRIAVTHLDPGGRAAEDGRGEARRRARAGLRHGHDGSPRCDAGPALRADRRAPHLGALPVPGEGARGACRGTQLPVLRRPHVPRRVRDAEVLRRPHGVRQQADQGHPGRGSADHVQPAEGAHILQDDAGGQPTWRQFKQWLANPALTWTTQPLGLMRFANFMVRTKQLSKMPASWRDLVFPPLHTSKGS